MTVAQQAQMCLCMAAVGALCGVIYDALALLRFALRAGAVLTGMMDLLFGLCCAAGMILCGLFLRQSPCRLFAFLSVGLGMAAYFGLSRTFVRLFTGFVSDDVKKSKKVYRNIRKDAGNSG